MTEEKKEKIISLVALILAFIALTICFLAYSSSIKIENELKTKRGYLESNVSFSVVANEILNGNISPIISSKSSKTPYASTAILNGTTISNIFVDFYEEDSEVLYKFYILNNSDKDLYLKDIIFLDIPYAGVKKKCIPFASDVSEEEIKDVCDSIKIGIINNGYSNQIIYDSIYDIEGVRINKNTYQEISLIISYEENDSELAIPFEIEFGDIYFKYDLNK